MHIARLEQLAPDFFARAALKEHVVGEHHGRLAADLEHAHDVLQKVELLV